MDIFFTDISGNRWIVAAKEEMASFSFSQRCLYKLCVRINKGDRPRIAIANRGKPFCGYSTYVQSIPICSTDLPSLSTYLVTLSEYFHVGSISVSFEYHNIVI